VVFVLRFIDGFGDADSVIRAAAFVGLVNGSAQSLVYDRLRPLRGRLWGRLENGRHFTPV